MSERADGPHARPVLTAYCIGALKLPAADQMRLANAIHARHHARPDAAMLWHLGADSPLGGLLGEAFRKPDASAIATFLHDAGEYGLWWPETWRQVSAHLRAQPSVCGLDVLLLQDRLDRSPHDWIDARDSRGQTLHEVLQDLRELRYAGSLTVVGDGPRCFTGDASRTITLRQLIEELGAAGPA